jgi:hypothetical protein
MKITILISTVVLLLVAFVGYASVQANPEPEPIKVEKKDKSKCFCDGLSLPQERQCPTMDDLDNGIILR